MTCEAGPSRRCLRAKCAAPAPRSAALIPRDASMVWPLCSTIRPPRGGEAGCFGRQHFLYFTPEPHGHGPFRGGVATGRPNWPSLTADVTTARRTPGCRDYSDASARAARVVV